MYWWEFIYGLIGTYTMNDRKRLLDLQDQAMKFNDEMEEKIKNNEASGMNPLLLKVFTYSKSWWFQTALALLYIWAVKVVGEIISGRDDDDRPRDRD